jgi:hypothetical protein
MGIHVSSNARSGWRCDADHDAADRASGHKITCPVIVLWADERLVASGMETGALTASDVWRRWADDVRGFDIASGHLLPEQAAEAVIEKVIPFLDACWSSQSGLGSSQLAQSLTISRKITQTELTSRLSSCGEGHGEMR